MKKDGALSIIAVLFLSFAIIAPGCGGGGGGDDTPPSPETQKTTVITGKVTLSGTAAPSPSFRGKTLSAQSGGYTMRSLLSMVGIEAQVALSTATVELYNADRPEWPYPVAVGLTDSGGNYTLDSLANAADNASFGAAYADGAPIPSGKYTLIASKYDINAGKLFVAVQAIVKRYEGTVQGNDLVAQDSNAVPTVVSMFGLGKNPDGTFGSAATQLPQNAAIQVTFSMAMARLRLLDAVNIADASGGAVAGIWKVSPDLLSATFYPDVNLTVGDVYTVTIKGGTLADAAINVYGKPIASNVQGSFTVIAADTTAPAAIRIRPDSGEKNNMPLTTPIRMGADEPLDLNTMVVASSPSIGDKPSVLFVGKNTTKPGYPFIYEIVPSIPLALATTYDITVSGGTDLAGNTMSPLNFQFTTEATSSGIDPTDPNADLQAQVKDVFGKWVRAIDDRSIPILTSHMSGDFSWIQTGLDNQDDLNRDGRLDLNEFTLMLGTWFGILDECASSVTGTIREDIDLDNDGAADGIVIGANGDTAHFAFDLTVDSTNTTNPECSEAAPSEALYMFLKYMNGAWILVGGADNLITTLPPPLDPISLELPADGHPFAEPSAALPLLPEFKWTGIAGVSTYAVVLMDMRSPWMETGWVALVDGTSSTGLTMTVKYTPQIGNTGNIHVMQNGEAFGFNGLLDEIRAGGIYSWTVMGFGTGTVAELASGTVDPLTDLTAASTSRKFTVKGIWKELQIVVSDASGTTYPFSDFSGGYDVGALGSVTLTVTTPDSASATGAHVSVYGYTWGEYNQPFDAAGVATVTIPLSRDRNEVQVCDNWDSNNWECIGYSKRFAVYTTGGIAPQIFIDTLTGYDCASPSNVVDLGEPDSWNNYRVQAEVCTVDVAGHVDDASGITALQLFVWAEAGRDQAPLLTIDPVVDNTFSFTGLKVFTGWNGIEVKDQTPAMNWTTQNRVGLKTLSGSTYIPPIEITSIVDSVGNPATLSWSGMDQSSWDVGADASVTIDGTMMYIGDFVNTWSSWNQQDEDGNWVSGGDITASPFSIPVALYTGWNFINFGDAQNNWYRVKIYTTGGNPFIVPNEITSVTDAAGTALPQTLGVYDAGTQCSVVIQGVTTSLSGPVYSYLHFEDSTSGLSYNESLTGAADAAGNYTFTWNIYSGGTNHINVTDSNGKWAGIQVTTTNTACVAVILDVVSVEGLAATNAVDLDGQPYYDVGSVSSVTINGTARDGVITADVYGSYSNQVTTTAVGGIFSLASVPIYNGFNYISITDGNNWYNLTVYTTGGTTVP